MPRVSVIIPTHNRFDLLPHAIDSVLGQTFKDFELIVVDDGSTDETQDLLRSYEAKGRLRGIRIEKRQGGNAARNAGLRLARGEFLAFLDDDDIWIPKKLESQLRVLERAPGVALVGCWFVRDGLVEKLPLEIPERMLLAGNFVGSFSFCMFRKSDLLAVGGLDETLRNSQDWDLWLRLAERGRIYIVPECLVKYATRRSDRVTEKRDRQEYYRHFLTVVSRHEHKMRFFTRLRHRRLALFDSTPSSQPFRRAGRGALFWIVHGIERAWLNLSVLLGGKIRRVLFHGATS